MYKKVRLLLLSIIFLVPFMVFAESKVENTNHSGDVYIASSELIKLSDGVEEVEKPTLKDLNVKFNIRFSEVNQSIEYKLIIKNTSNKDYNISTDNSFNKSDYITYNFKYDDGSDIIKANSEEEMLVTIVYTKEVPDNKLTDGKFIEDNAMSLNLSDEITNPSTILQRYGVNILLIIITCVVAFYFLKTKNIKNSLKVLLLGLMLIPLTARSLDSIKVTIDSHVEVEKSSEFCYYTYIDEGIVNGTETSEIHPEVDEADALLAASEIHPEVQASEVQALLRYPGVQALYKYRKGMTWSEYLNSDYNKITDSTTISYYKQLNAKDYMNKQLNVKDYIKKWSEEETKWLESCKNASKETYCPPYTSINYENMKLFAERDDYDDYDDYIDNGVLNLPGFNLFPNRFNDGDFSNVNDLLKSEIKDYSQGCYGIYGFG